MEFTRGDLINLAYVVAGVFSGISGILWAFYNGFVSPMDAELTSSFEAFLMVILGGAGTLAGPAIGAGIIVFLKNFIRMVPCKILSNGIPKILQFCHKHYLFYANKIYNYLIIL